MATKAERDRADWFAGFLRMIGACGNSRVWSKGMTIRQAWTRCTNPEWMVWFVSLVGGDKTFFRIADLSTQITHAAINNNTIETFTACDSIRKKISAAKIEKCAHQYERNFL